MSYQVFIPSAPPCLQSLRLFTRTGKCVVFIVVVALARLREVTNGREKRHDEQFCAELVRGSRFDAAEAHPILSGVALIRGKSLPVDANRIISPRITLSAST
jgi:hypothetical protein